MTAQLLGSLVNLTQILSMAAQPNLCTHDVISASNFSCNRLNTFKTNFDDGNFSTRTLVNAEQLRISINNRDYIKNYQDVSFEIDKDVSMITTRTLKNKVLCDATEKPTGFSRDYNRQLDISLTKSGIFTVTVYNAVGEENFKLSCETGEEFIIAESSLCVNYNDFFFHEVDHLDFYYDCPLEGHRDSSLEEIKV
ncbi:hypothetical protein ACFFRR_000333 [Megaselia abdita]